MKLINAVFILPLMVFAGTSALSQADSTIGVKEKQLIKGLYRNYHEFISNKPSYTGSFTVTTRYVDEIDSTKILAARYQLDDTLQTLDYIWGFCDGQSVYINSSTSLTIRYYWKIISLGKYPFFKGASNIKRFPGLGILAPAEFLAQQVIRFKPRNLLIQIITEKGRLKEPDIAYMKKLMKQAPGLLEAFSAEAAPYEKFDNPNVDVYESEEDYQNKIAIISRYLVKLNEVVKN